MRRDVRPRSAGHRYDNADSANGRTAAIVPNPPDSFAYFMMILASEKDELTAGVASLCELISLAVSSARWRASLSGEPADSKAIAVTTLRRWTQFANLRDRSFRSARSPIGVLTDPRTRW